jgi:hypothetical protein
MKGLYNKYIFTTAGIYGLYGIYNTYNADVIRKNEVINKMLIGEKIPIIFCYICSGPLKFPCGVFNFINYLEIKCRNECPLNYDYKSKFEKEPKLLYQYLP